MITLIIFQNNAQRITVANNIINSQRGMVHVYNMYLYSQTIISLWMEPLCD